jgi:hypothetical protein
MNYLGIITDSHFFMFALTGGFSRLFFFCPKLSKRGRFLKPATFFCPQKRPFWFVFFQKCNTHENQAIIKNTKKQSPQNNTNLPKNLVHFSQVRKKPKNAK